MGFLETSSFGKDDGDIPKEIKPGNATTRRYSEQEKAAAVRMVRQLRKDLGTDHGTVKRVATQLEYGPESVRSRVRQADIDEGHTPGQSAQAVRARESPGTREPRTTARQRDPETGDFLRGGARPPVTEIIAFIEANKDDVIDGRRLGVEPICTMLQMAPSTYYAAKHREPSARSVRDSELIPQLVSLHAQNYGVYGARKLWKAVNRAGMSIGRDQTARLMRHADLEGVLRRKKIRMSTSIENWSLIDV